MDTEQYVKWFRSTSPYINANRERCFVLALSGELLKHANFPVLMEDIVLLHSLGVRLVLCIDADSQQAQLSASGPIDGEAIEQFSAQLGAECFRVQATLCRALRGPKAGRHKLRVVSGSFTSARPLGVVNGEDHLHQGTVRRVDSHALQTQLAQGNVVLQPAMASSPSGELFKLDSNELACAIASKLQADKLILFTDAQGLLAEGKLLREINLTEARALLDNTNSNADQDRLRTAIQACETGVERIQIVSYTDPSALLTELFSRDGSGTLVSETSFETIRDANIDDIASILELIEPLERDGTLVKRSREKLEEEIQYFSLIERDASVVACAAMYPIANTESAEVACVVTHPEYRNSGRADKLLQHLLKKARSQKLRTLFVLTTKAAHWFVEKEFEECGLDQLPVQRQALYNSQRNSKVLRRFIS